MGLTPYRGTESTLRLSSSKQSEASVHVDPDHPHRNHAGYDRPD